MNDATESAAGHRFDLTAPAPVRALAISAGAAVVAIVLLVVWGVSDLLVVLVLGIALLVLAVSLAVVALVLTRRLRTSVVLDPESITVVRGRLSRELRWSEVEQVDLRAARLSFSVKDAGTDAYVINPRTPADPTFLALVSEIRVRLDADRGYGGSPF